eukprot:GEMP01010496.1.p1 GENE.GEMP01010496.1~~GEMP01010496.1.p1  ORF type:complete len:627 (+),score=177.48 GEMP01010496.1:299-2179(+)
MSHRDEGRPCSTASTYAVPSHEERKFCSAVFMSSQYGRAKANLFEFCATLDWPARRGESAKMILASAEDAFKTHTDATLNVAWSIIGRRVEDAGVIRQELKDTQKRLKLSLRAYLKELTYLKMALRSTKSYAEEVELYVPDFTEDVNFFDALQFFEEEEKELVKEIVVDKVKTAVARALSGGRVDSLSPPPDRSDGVDPNDFSRSQERVKSLEAEISRLMCKLEETQDEFMRERQQSAECSQLLITLEACVAEKETHIHDLSDERDMLTAANCDLQARVEEEEKKSTLLLEQNRAMEMSLDLCKAELLEAEDKSAVMQMELAELKGRLSQADSAAEVFEVEKRKLEEEKLKLQTLAASGREIEDKLNARISVLHEETQHLRQESDALRTEHAKEKKEKEFEAMKRRESDALLDSARSAVALAHKQASEMESANAKMQKRIFELELRLADMHEKIQQVRAGGADAGVGEELEALLEKSGISASPSPRTVFERLHSDAIARIARLEQFRLEILRVQREALCKVLAACRHTVDKDQFAPHPSLEPANGLRKCNSEWFPPVGNYPNYESTKTEEVIDTLRMLQSRGRRPQNAFGDTFPLLDRGGKLRPIDRKVNALRRSSAGTLIGYSLA